MNIILIPELYNLYKRSLREKEDPTPAENKEVQEHRKNIIRKFNLSHGPGLRKKQRSKRKKNKKKR